MVLYNFCFVTPLFSFDSYDRSYLVTFAIMFATAMVAAELDQHQIARAVERLSRIPEVLECFAPAGETDLLCRVVVETPVGLNEKQKQLLQELQESFGGPTGEHNSPRSKSFFDGVKKFFDDLTR